MATGTYCHSCNSVMCGHIIGCYIAESRMNNIEYDLRRREMMTAQNASYVANKVSDLGSFIAIATGMTKRKKLLLLLRK